MRWSETNFIWAWWIPNQEMKMKMKATKTNLLCELANVWLILDYNLLLVLHISCAVYLALTGFLMLELTLTSIPWMLYTSPLLENDRGDGEAEWTNRTRFEILVRNHIGETRPHADSILQHKYRLLYLQH